MKNHPKEIKEYARIKKEAVNLGFEGEKYRNHKNKFLEEITKKALKELS